MIQWLKSFRLIDCSGRRLEVSCQRWTSRNHSRDTSPSQNISHAILGTYYRWKEGFTTSVHHNLQLSYCRYPKLEMHLEMDWFSSRKLRQRSSMGEYGILCLQQRRKRKSALWQAFSYWNFELASHLLRRTPRRNHRARRTHPLSTDKRTRTKWKVSSARSSSQMGCSCNSCASRIHVRR